MTSKRIGFNNRDDYYSDSINEEKEINSTSITQTSDQASWIFDTTSIDSDIPENSQKVKLDSRRFSFQNINEFKSKVYVLNLK